MTDRAGWGGKLEEYRGKQRTRREWAKHFRISYRELVIARERGFTYEDIAAKRHVKSQKWQPRRKWSSEEDATLQRLTAEGRPPQEIAQHIDRTEGAIVARLYVLAKR
ncbi:MAG: hypothetical protein AAF645_23720 [Myxococcota bacterium]